LTASNASAVLIGRKKSRGYLFNIIVYRLYILWMYSGAVSLDGRIEPGDMILEVNGISFENLSNDEAVRILRDVVQKSG